MPRDSVDRLMTDWEREATESAADQDLTRVRYLQHMAERASVILTEKEAERRTRQAEQRVGLR